MSGDLNLKAGQKARLRDSRGRPYYLADLPWYRKHPRAFIITGSVLSLLLMISGPIYRGFNAKNLTPEDLLWPSEVARGKTNRQRLLEKYAPEEYAKEMAELAAAKQKDI